MQWSLSISGGLIPGSPIQIPQSQESLIQSYLQISPLPICPQSPLEDLRYLVQTDARLCFLQNEDKKQGSTLSTAHFFPQNTSDPCLVEFMNVSPWV